MSHQAASRTGSGAPAIVKTVFYVVALAVGLGSLGLGTWGVVGGLRTLHLSRAFQDWPSTIGTLTEARIERRTSTTGRGSGTTWKVHVGYDYAVDGRTYHGTRLGAGDGVFQTRTAAQEAMPSGRQGSAVSVFYDPADPADALLIPGTTSGTDWWFMLTVGIVLFAFGTFVMRAFYLDMIGRLKRPKRS